MSEMRNIGLSSFTQVAIEGIRAADREQNREREDAVGFISPSIRDALETTTRDLASLAQQTVDGFNGHAGTTTEPSPWNKHHKRIGLELPGQKPDGVSDLDAARTVHDIAQGALDEARSKPLPVQVGIYQGTLMAVNCLNAISLNCIGDAAKTVLEVRNIRYHTDMTALHAKPAEEEKADGEAATTEKKTSAYTEEDVTQGTEAVLTAGIAALRRASVALNDATAIGLLNNAALSASTRLAALSACATPPLPPSGSGK